MNEFVQDAQNLPVVRKPMMRPAQAVATTHKSMAAPVHLATMRARFVKPRAADLCQSPHPAMMDRLEAAS